MEEKLRIAMLLSFISGFINAFTFITQEGRFAGIQTGNLIYLAMYFAQGKFSEVTSFLLPIIVFMVGQLFTYYVGKVSEHHHLNWSFVASLLMLFITSLTAILTPKFSHVFTIINLTFVSSIQIGTFQKMHGVSYASVMMTGNIRNASFQLAKGIVEKNRDILQESFELFLIILSFVGGVILSTYLVYSFLEYTLYFVLCPLTILVYFLKKEKEPA